MPPGPKVEHKSFGQEIVIRDVDHSDKGQYECFADNRAVSDPVSREFTVHVECKCQGVTFTFTLVLISVVLTF